VIGVERGVVLSDGTHSSIHRTPVDSMPGSRRIAFRLSGGSERSEAFVILTEAKHLSF